jgi:hypothetical protein
VAKPFALRLYIVGASHRQQNRQDTPRRSEKDASGSEHEQLRVRRERAAEHRALQAKEVNRNRDIGEEHAVLEQRRL